jgi:hypothetical protein
MISSYRRPWSHAELRQMRRQKTEMIVGAGVFTSLGLAALVTVISLVYLAALR